MSRTAFPVLNILPASDQHLCRNAWHHPPVGLADQHLDQRAEPVGAREAAEVSRRDGRAAHRGTATEAGVSAGLFDHDLSVEDCAAVALPIYDKLTALTGDPEARRRARRHPRHGRAGAGAARAWRADPPNQPARSAAATSTRSRSAGGRERPDHRLPRLAVPRRDPGPEDDAARAVAMSDDAPAPGVTIYKTAHMDRRVRFFYVSDKRSEKHTLTREQYDVAMRELVRGAAPRTLPGLSLPTRTSWRPSCRTPATASTSTTPHTKAKAIEVFGY
jgi:hypothetical protein